MEGFNPIGLLFSAAGHAREAWAKRQEHGGSFKAAAQRESELIGKTQLKATAFHVGARYMRDSMSMAARRGDYAMMALYNIGHGILQRHAQKTQHEQQTFELTKMVERGEHHHLTASQLRHVADNAHMFGGPNAETIKAKAQEAEVDRERNKQHAKIKVAQEKAAAAAAANAEARKAGEERRAAQKAQKEAEREKREAQRKQDKDAEKAARDKERAARAAKEEAAAKERAHKNSPEGVRQQMLARQHAKIAMMSSPEYMELRKKEMQLKQSVKAAAKEQQRNQTTYKPKGPGRPDEGKGTGKSKAEMVGAKPGKGGLKGTTAGKKKGAPKMEGVNPADYDAQGRNIHTGQLARGSVRATLIDLGKVKPSKVRPSVKGAARKSKKPPQT